MAKVVLITGASRGLGRQCAGYLASKNYKVYGTSRNAQFGDKLDNFNLIPCDLLIEASVKEAVQHILTQEGHIDILVNNAGRGMLGSAEDASITESKTLFDLNFHGTERITKHVLENMRPRKQGQIINITSIAGIISLPFRSHYCATKSALEGWSASLRMEVQTFGINVSIVAPGDFKSDISSGRIVAEKSNKSVYAENFSRISKKIDEEVSSGSDISVIIKVIEKVITSKNPKPRYIAASSFQKFAVKLKSFLPQMVFENILMKTYGLK